MTGVAVAVVHAPWFEDRRSVVADLRESCSDADAFAEIHATEYESRTRTNTRAWTWGVESGASHIVVLEDDVELCSEFVAAVRKLIGQCEDVPLSLFNKKAVHDEPWIVTNTGITAQAICMPADLASEYARWTGKPSNSALAARPDKALQAFLYLKDRPVWIPTPGFVDHRGGDGYIGESEAVEGTHPAGTIGAATAYEPDGSDRSYQPGDALKEYLYEDPNRQLLADLFL